MKIFRRPSIAVLIVLNLWPTLASGQATRPAGVVSALQGTATASRANAALPLKFKDDVFLQDRIQTGDQSVARILLGGKALVTVRERSVLTVTEIPGRATVNLESGKIGLAVARERMAPGEAFEIRTSNAVAAVRGTVVVAEVTRATAQATPGPIQVVSNFYVLRDPTNRGIQITSLGTGATSNLLPGQGFSVLGATAGRNVPIPPNATAGLQTPAGAQHSEGSAAAITNVAGIQTQQAAALINVVLPSLSTPASEGTLIAQTQTTTPAVSTSQIGVNEEQAAQTIPDVVAPPPTTPTVPPIVGANLTPTEPLVTFTGSFASTSPDPLVVISSSSVSGPTNLIAVDPGADVSLAGPLANVVNTSLATDANLVDILGNVSSTSSSPFLDFDPTTVNAIRDLLHIGSNGSLTLAGGVFRDVGGTLTAGGSLFRLDGNGSVTSTGPGPVAEFTGSTVTAGQSFVNLSGNARAVFNGPMIRATDSTFRVLGGGAGGVPAGFEPSFGSVLALFDDSTTTRALPFNFPFVGQNFNSVNISSNGFLSFGADFGADCCNGDRTRLLTSGPRAAGAWFDLISASGGGAGTIFFNALADRAFATWQNVNEFCCTGSNTFQIQIFSDGRVQFVYGSVLAQNHVALIGVSPGGGVADPGPIDFSSSLPFNSGSVGTVYQEFPPGTLNITSASLLFTPNGLGGWTVTGSFESQGAFIAVTSGASLTQGGSGPLVDLLRTALTVAGQFLVIDASSGAATAVQIVDQLLSAIDSPLDITGALVKSTSGTLTVTGAGSSPLASITRGTHSIATDVDTAVFDLTGLTTAGQTIEGNNLTLGTEAVIQHGARVMLETDAATVTTNGLVRLDTVLLDATRPLFNALNNSVITSANDFVNLVNRANLTANIAPADALVQLNASRLTINNGSLFNVAGGSALLVTGNLLGLTNSSTVDILAGSLVTVSGGSVFRLTGGSLVSFGTGTNTLTITTPGGCGGCVSNIPNLGGVNVLLLNGATASNVSVAPGFVPFAGTGTVNSASGAVLTVDGNTSRVRLAP